MAAAGDALVSHQVKSLMTSITGHTTLQASFLSHTTKSSILRPRAIAIPSETKRHELVMRVV